MTRVAVVGGGSWGTGFASVVAEAGCEATLWAREPGIVADINDRHENPAFHPGIALPESLRATTEIGAAVDGADFVILAIPSQVLRENLAAWKHLVPADAVYVSLMKGIELDTCLRMTEVVREVTGVDEHRVAAVSGPNLAREVMAGQPAATVVACTDDEVATRLQAACQTALFRPYTNTDVVGVELGGACKNVIALAVGMAAGLGFGDNSKAALITRGLAEIVRLGQALGADPQTFAGLAGLGDLVATCTSPLSRNRTFGENLGKGMTVDDVVAVTRQTAEGVKSCRSIQDLARRHGVDVPVTDEVVAVVHDGVKPAAVIGRLMSRSAKPEWR